MNATAPQIDLDRLDVRRAVHAPGLLGEFNGAGVLAAADVHVAQRLAALGGGAGDDVLLAAALAVRGPRLGHVCVDLATIRDSAAVDAEEAVDLGALRWPEPDSWLAHVARWSLVAVGDDGDGADRPLRLIGTALYLDRYWREERRVAEDLAAFAAPADGIDDAVLGAGLVRVFDGATGTRQAVAAAAAVLRRFAVVAGGPGTGKTTTVARIVALLAEQAEAAGQPPPLVALAAPTGKAAARLQEAVRGAADDLGVDAAIREQLRALEASTLHRLLGWRPGSHSRFRHHRSNRLPHDVVIVDETSMVSLSLMARLVDAVRPGARLILVGDPGQLASIEAGVVLGDIVGPTTAGLRIGPATRARLAAAVGHEVEAADAPSDTGVADGIVILDQVHRYGGAIAGVAHAIRRGDADAVVEALATAPPHAAHWIAADPGDPGSTAAVERIRAEVAAFAAPVVAAARAGDARAALEALGGFRLLCAHRRGPHGVAWWTERIETWLTHDLDGFAADARWYTGRPLLVTRTDYALRLYNGDAGVVVRTAEGEVAAAFDRGTDIARIRPGRLESVETVYAMTIHKSQGSQFDTVAVLLPPRTSPILTRELLYTAVTRARERLLVVGSEESLRAAVDSPIARASGLRSRLWGM
ncbi:MAG TPA: exodeoxyribonuclease V subunit alpha [Solirubrobacteraceae bacterium]|nr:exodeoxyribonuclease V subunit alpha [Solirubrobacteraceae bacterium]